MIDHSSLELFHANMECACLGTSYFYPSLRPRPDSKCIGCQSAKRIFSIIFVLFDPLREKRQILVRYTCNPVTELHGNDTKR